MTIVESHVEECGGRITYYCNCCSWLLKCLNIETVMILD